MAGVYVAEKSMLYFLHQKVTCSCVQGMTLFFNCCHCGQRWRDYV